MYGEQQDLLRRLACIEGHLRGIRRMVEAEQPCIDILKQTYAVRRALDRVDGLLLSHYLSGAVLDTSATSMVSNLFGLATMLTQKLPTERAGLLQG